MTQINGKNLTLDNVTLQTDAAGIIKQVPGTDGGAPDIQTDPFLLNTLLLGLKYVDLNFPPSDVDGIVLYILTSDGSKSPPQERGDSYTLVRSSVGGIFNRVVFSNTVTPGLGDGTAIPELDPVPSSDLLPYLVEGDTLVVKYTKGV